MRIVRQIADIRAALHSTRASRAASVGLVPTMGALHAGHVSLFRAARGECDTVVASVFVNPAQFGEPADFEHYPRDEARDAAVAEEAGVDLLFAPEAQEIYPARIRHVGGRGSARHDPGGRVPAGPLSGRGDGVPASCSTSSTLTWPISGRRTRNRCR